MSTLLEVLTVAGLFVLAWIGAVLLHSPPKRSVKLLFHTCGWLAVASLASSPFTPDSLDGITAGAVVVFAMAWLVLGAVNHERQKSV